MGGDARTNAVLDCLITHFLCAEAGQAGQRDRQRVRGGLCYFSFIVVVLCNDALLCSAWFESGDGEGAPPVCSTNPSLAMLCLCCATHTHTHTHESGGLTRPCRLGSQAREGASGRWKKQLTLDLLGSSFDDAGRCRHLIARLKTFCPTRSEGQGGTGQSRAGGKSEGGGLWRLPVWTLDQDERVSSGVRGVCMLPDETAVS